MTPEHTTAILEQEGYTAEEIDYALKQLAETEGVARPAAYCRSIIKNFRNRGSWEPCGKCERGFVWQTDERPATVAYCSCHPRCGVEDE